MFGRIAECDRDYGPATVPVFHGEPNSGSRAYIVLMSTIRNSKPSPSIPPSPRAKAKIISSRVAYRGPVFWVTTDDVLEPNGVRARRDVIHHTGSVVILAVDDSRSVPRVLLERQYRHGCE